METSGLLSMTTPSSVPLRKGRLLIVDDDLSVLQAVSKVLQRQGYDTQECVSGAKALTVLQQAEFDVLLCDVLMAGMDGITLLRSAREIAPELVGILMTGKSSVESAVEAMRTEAAVRREEEYFRSLTENALDLVCLLDAEGKIRYLSPSISPMLGYQGEELIGQFSFSFLHPDEQVRVQEEFVRLLTTPGGMTNLEYRVFRKDGSYRILESVMHNLLANPAVAEVVINARDITERKEAVRVKEEMVAIVSHELRTPLTSLRGFAELLLKRNYPAEKQGEFLTIIHNEAVRLNNLTNDFLDMQRLQSGQMVYHFASVELAVLLGEAIAPFIQGEGKPTIRLEITNGLPPVQADAARLRQVLVNLLSNAIKFSPQRGEITVSARTEGARVTVWVADQGLGIPREEISKMNYSAMSKGPIPVQIPPRVG